MKMAYLATNPKTNDSYAFCSASPEFIDEAASDIRRWKNEGALIELLPVDEAMEKFHKSIKAKPKQQNLF